MHEPYLFAPLPDGRRVITWSDAERTRRQLAADWSPADADAYASWAREREAAAARARPLMLEPPDREAWLAAVGPERLEGSIADELSAIPSEAVRVPFAIQGLIGTLAAPEDAGTAFVALYHDLGEAGGSPGAWGFARGGMGAVTAALRSAAEAAGARVHTAAPVRAGAGGGRTRQPAWCWMEAGRWRPGPCCPTPTRWPRPPWRAWRRRRAGGRRGRW